MGQALADGLNSKAGAVEAAARRLANAAAAAVRAAAAIRSPSRVFIELGDQMAAGLAVGLDDGRDEVAKAGGRLVDTLADVMGRAQQEFRLDGSDAWWGDFNARVNAELAKYDGSRGEAATGRQVTINTNIYNPVPESGSDSVAKTHRRQAAMGLFG